MSKRALITGITGQDGSYLAQLLLEKGYEVHGVIRRSSSFNTGRIDHLYQEPHAPERRLHLHYGDMLDASSLIDVLAKARPHEVYNLAAQSHVAVSFAQPAYTAAVTGVGVVHLLEGIRTLGLPTRLFQPSSSEMFGNARPPQDENTPFGPLSPYAAAKVFAHHTVGTYRKAYGLFACCGIMFNHESPRRGETFVTRKITRAVGRIAAGLQEKVYLGNLKACRDWGYAPEYMAAAWRMLQMDEPADMVIATGRAHSVAEFAELAFRELCLDWRRYVVADSRYVRPTEIDQLCGEAQKARKLIGFQPRTDFRELVKIMVEADFQLAAGEKRSGCASLRRDQLTG